MTYPALCVVFLAVAVVAALVLGRGAATGTRRRTSVAVAGAAAALILLTAVFDNVMIAAGLFAYDDAHISGVRLGRAPVEDFAYPIAAVILLPAIWSRLRRPRKGADAGARRDP